MLAKTKNSETKTSVSDGLSKALYNTNQFVMRPAGLEKDAVDHPMYKTAKNIRLIRTVAQKNSF